MDDNQTPAKRAAQADEAQPTAIDTAYRAIQVARRLSPSMQRALKLAWKGPEDVVLLDYGHVRRNTCTALRARQLVRGFALTDFGSIVRAVLLTSAEDVLTYAQRRDRTEHAAGYNALGAAAGRAAALWAIESGFSERWIGNALDEITHRADSRAIAYRAELLDELHTRALVEDHQRTRSMTVLGTDDVRTIAQQLRESPTSATSIDRVDHMRDVVRSLRLRDGES